MRGDHIDVLHGFFHAVCHSGELFRLKAKGLENGQHHLTLPAQRLIFVLQHFPSLSAYVHQ